MNMQERAERIAKFHSEQMEILRAKGADYSGGKDTVDANSNFKDVARLLEGAPVSAMTVWAVYFLKHVLAVMTFIKTGRVESEGLAGRFDDLANYANIGRAMIEEIEEAQKEAVGKYMDLTADRPPVPVYEIGSARDGIIVQIGG